MNQSFAMHDVVELWESLESSKCWPPVEWAERCEDRPGVVVLGGDSETFAVLDMIQRRELSEEEFPSYHLGDDSRRLRWTKVPLLAAI